VVPRLARVLTAALAGAAACAAPAHALSQKVALGNFTWTPTDVTVAVGDDVTWFWVGPDTQHSITALSPPSGVDSDPGDAAPSHAAGDRFTVTFDKPGTYEFHCKLHALVRGTVHVVDTPGLAGPSIEPDPPVVGDLIAPDLTEARWSGPVRRGRPATLRWTSDEAGRLRMDVMQPRRGTDRYLGGRSYPAHIGWNQASFRGVLRGKRLKAGRYYVLLRATDAAGNASPDRRLPLRVAR
jgi:plastocyanin